MVLSEFRAWSDAAMSFDACSSEHFAMTCAVIPADLIVNFDAPDLEVW
jgi:hypothetical protein